jgi:hypothetical protein
MPYFDVSAEIQLGFTPHYPVTQELIAPHLATPVGAGASQLHRQYGRPLSRFTLRDAQADKARMDTLFGFITFVQGDTPFFWDGGEWGTISTPLYIGYGDGVRTEFLLPNRYITGDLQVYCNTVLVVPTPGIDGAAGHITLPSPLVGALTATYRCVFKVTFALKGEVLFSASNLAEHLYSHEGVTLLEFVP